MEALLCMRRILLEITSGYDVMLRACTIAGVAMRIFRKMFLPKNHLPIIPENGYERLDRYFQRNFKSVNKKYLHFFRASDKAILFMEWHAKK